MPQQAILDRLAFGNPGDLFDASSIRALSYLLNSGDLANNVFGRAFSHVAAAEDQVEAGGTGVFAGYLINNKEHILEGTATGVLEPRNYLRNGVAASFCNFGLIYVKIPAVAAIGDIVTYFEADGTLNTIAPGVAVPAGQQFGNAVVERFIPIQQDPIDSEYLAVIRITDAPQRP